MFFLNILTGSQTGNFISLPPEQVISISSSFGSDVYLLLPDDMEFDGQLKIDSFGQVWFLSANQEVMVNNQPLQLNTPYQIPALLKIGSLAFAISNKQQISLEDINGILEPDADGLEDEDSPSHEALSEMGIILEDEDDLANATKSGWSAKLFGRLNQNKFVCLLIRWLHHPVVQSSIAKVQLFLGYGLSYLRYYFQLLLKRLGYWLYIICGIVLLTIVVTGYTLFYLHQQEKYEQKVEQTQTTKSKLQQQLIKLPNKYSNLKIVKVEQGFVLRGVISSESDIRFLKKSFSAFDSHMGYDLLAFSQIESQLSKIMQQHKVIRPNVVFQDDSGNIALSGLVSTVQTIDDLEIAITNQFNKIGQIDAAKLFVISEVDNDISNILSTGNYQSHLEIGKNYPAGNIVVSGYLPSAILNDLKKQVELFNQKYLPVIAMDLRIEDIVKAIPFKIVEIYYGSPSYIVTEDGVRVYQGGSYAGLSLVQVDKDKLTFQGKYTITISNRELLEHQPSAENNLALNYSTDKNSLIAQEKILESTEINNKLKQLHTLQALLTESGNQGYTSSIVPLIEELQNEIKEKQHEYNYYFEKNS